MPSPFQVLQAVAVQRHHAGLRAGEERRDQDQDCQYREEQAQRGVVQEWLTPQSKGNRNGGEKCPEAQAFCAQWRRAKSVTLLAAKPAPIPALIQRIRGRPSRMQ